MKRKADQGILQLNIAGVKFDVLFDGKSVRDVDNNKLLKSFNAKCGMRITQSMLVHACRGKIWREDLVLRQNMMSGLGFYEARNTPLCCSPASETYWCM